VRIVEKVKYENYQRFGSNVKITYEGQELNKDQQKTGTQQPQPQQTPPPPQK
jgi:hypothetical protein